FSTPTLSLSRRTTSLAPWRNCTRLRESPPCVARCCLSVTATGTRGRSGNKSEHSCGRSQGHRSWLITGGATSLRDSQTSIVKSLIYKGQTLFFGTITTPFGGAVAYRRKYVEEFFGHFGPPLGDDLTNSEDIFIGLAMLDNGYRNAQLTDVSARPVEPPVHKLP